MMHRLSSGASNLFRNLCCVVTMVVKAWPTDLFWWPFSIYQIGGVAEFVKIDDVWIFWNIILFHRIKDR